MSKEHLERTVRNPFRYGGGARGDDHRTAKRSFAQVIVNRL